MKNMYTVNYNLKFLDDGEIINCTGHYIAYSAGAAKEIVRDLFTDDLVKVEVLNVEFYA